MSHDLAAGLFSTRLVVLHVISSENSHPGFTNRMKEALRKEKVWQAISRRSVHLQLREQRGKKMGGGGGDVVKGRLCSGALLALKGLWLLNSVHRSSWRVLIRRRIPDLYFQMLALAAMCSMDYSGREQGG